MKTKPRTKIAAPKVLAERRPRTISRQMPPCPRCGRRVGHRTAAQVETCIARSPKPAPDPKPPRAAELPAVLSELQMISARLDALERPRSESGGGWLDFFEG